MESLTYEATFFARELPCRGVLVRVGGRTVLAGGHVDELRQLLSVTHLTCGLRHEEATPTMLG